MSRRRSPPNGKGSRKLSRRKSVHRKAADKQRYKRSQTSSRRTTISDARLERGLRVLSETKDIGTAARSIRVSVERFRRAAQRRNAIRKQQRNWTVVRRLRRKMPIFSSGRQMAITVRSKSASLIGEYMSAVGQFLKTNDPKHLAEFRGRSVADIRGKSYPFETDPNTLYRLSSAGAEPFEEMYRIVI